MLKKISFLLCISLFTISTYCQHVQVEKLAHHHDEVTTKVESKTIFIDVSKLTENQRGELKDELIGYKEKVISLTLNEKPSEIILQHSLAFLHSEIVFVLKKYKLDSSFISYQKEE